MIPEKAQAVQLIKWFEKYGMIHLTSGKTREMFTLPGHKDYMLIYATNRISIFDIVLNALVYKKGEVLTALTVFWLTKLCPALGTETHLVAFGNGIDEYLPKKLRNIPDLWKRSLVVKVADVLPVEAIVRGRLTGSGLKDYMATGMVCGIELDAGLHDGSRIDPPIFTPSTKEDMGKHDQNIPFEVMVDKVGRELAKQVKLQSLKMFTKANEMVNGNGVVIADTKFEWGIDPITKQLILVDEILTPDSSRFWPAQPEYETSPNSFDKQPVRDWGKQAGIKKDSSIIPPDEVLSATTGRYLLAIEMICGRTLEQFQQNVMGV